MIHRRQLYLSVFSLVLLSLSVNLEAQPAAEGVPAEQQAEAYRLFMLGRFLEDEGDADGAIRSFREAAELDIHSGEPLAELASLFSRARRREEAVTAARSALEREPVNLTAHRILGLIYSSIANDQDGTIADATEAITHLEQARGTLLPDLQVELTLARLYLIAERSPDAIELLEALQQRGLGSGQSVLLLSHAYEQVGRGEDALTVIEAAVTNGQPSFRMYERLGELYERQQRWDDAVVAFRRAVSRNVRSASVRRRLANALVSSGDPSSARDVLRDLLEMRPRDARALVLLSDVELSLNNFQAAENVARQLIELEPGGLRGPFALAEVFERRREFQQVIDTLEPILEEIRAQVSDPRQLVGVLGRIGFAYERLGALQRAAASYEEVLEVIPESFAFSARLAQVYVDSNLVSEAMQIVERTRNSHPNNLTLSRIEAQVLERQGSVGAATRVLEEAFERSDDQPTAYIVLSNFYSGHGRSDEAVVLLESALERFPENTSLLFQLGAVFEQHDQFVDAERTFRMLLNNDPNHEMALNYLGYMLADRGERLEESVALLEQAVAIDPHNGSYLDSLGWAYFKLDRLDLAETPLRAAAVQLPTNSVVQDHLGDLLFSLGLFGEAIQAWERALAGDGDEIDPGRIETKIDEAR